MNIRLYEGIFIERQWETDRTKLVEGMDKILVDYPDGYFCNVRINRKKLTFQSIK